MPANIESFVRASNTQPAWHGLGGTIDPNAGIDAWQVAAGMDFEVLSSNVFYRAGNQALVDATKQVFYRSDRPETVLGIMSDQFKPVQPREALEFFDKFQNELGITLDTAGVLQGGAKYWALAKIGSHVEINGVDRFDDYLLVATANDGSMATRIMHCRVRVVCQNTLNAAISQGDSILTINHRQTVNWEQARAYVTGEQESFQIFGEFMQSLADIEVSTEQATEFATRLIAPEWDRKSKAPRKLLKFADTLQNGIGQREAGSTAFGLLNAVTRYTDHDKQARSRDSRLNSAWFGQSNNLKNQALDLLVKNCVNKWGHESALAPVLAHTKWKDAA